MMSFIKKMLGDKQGWYKVSALRPGAEIAVPSLRTPNSELRTLEWDEIVSITPVGRERVYDIEVEGTHNFVGNGIFAHNTYVLRANTMLAVEGEVNAGSFTVPIGSVADATSTSALGRQIPSSVLTADGKGVDLFKLATYNLSAEQALAARMDAEEVRVTSLETRVDKLESGAIGSQASNTISGSLTSSLASALNEFGVLISNGFAQFGSLIADRFVAATDSAGTSSAGTASVLAGNTTVQITNAYVATSTKIFVTFNSQVTGNWWVSDKIAGSFRVVLSAPQTNDVSFDYFLVQTVGQTATSTPPQTTDIRASEIGSPIPSSVNPTSDTPFPDLQSAASSTPQSSPEATTVAAVSSPSDNIPPIVTLVGPAALQINVGDAFTDPGATAADPSTGSGQATDLTTHIIVSGSVDTATAGLYTLTYTATDAAGNTGSASRLVTVVATPTPATPANATSSPPVQ